MNRPRLLVVTNFATHYRAPLFRLLHERLGAEFIFFSEGGEEYWQPHLGVTQGAFPGTTAVGGPHVGRKLRFNTALAREIRSRRFDVMVKCMNGRVELPTAYAIARSKGSAFVLWTGMWMHPQTLFHSLSRPFARYLYRHADAVVTYGRHVSRHVVSEGARSSGVFEAENATNGELYGRCVRPEEIRGFRRAHDLGDERIVLAVSRLVEQKGLDILVAAVAALGPPRPQLVIVGTGLAAEQLHRQAESRGVRLSIVQGLQPWVMPPVYASADVFVMPSITTRTIKETWGLACNEAMSQGIPVIASTAVGAVAGGLVRHEETGLVVQEGDPESLRGALERVLQDDNLAQRLGGNGRRRVARTDYEGMAAGFGEAIAFAVASRMRE